MAASHAEPAAHRVLARLAQPQFANFALLRTRPEGLPTPVRRILRAPIVGMNWSLAQRMPVAVPGGYWLVPGIGYLCVVTQVPATPGVGTVCAKTAQAVEHGIASVALPRASGTSPVDGPRLIVGVAPDGARTVLARTGDAVAAIHVAGGLFVRRDTAATPPDLLTLR